MEPVPTLGLPGECWGDLDLDDEDLAGEASLLFRRSSSRIIWRAMSDMGAILTSDSPTCSL